MGSSICWVIAVVQFYVGILFSNFGDWWSSVESFEPLNMFMSRGGGGEACLQVFLCPT